MTSRICTLAAIVSLFSLAVRSGHAAPSVKQRALPLVHLSVAGGKAPKVATTATGFEVANTGRIEADVAVPPDAFLCRLNPGADSDVVQLSIGRVDSLCCNAVFSPSRDEGVSFAASSLSLQWRGGYHLIAQGPLTVEIHRDFMKTERGIKWFKPLDKTYFKRAPAGWCSWYVYYQGITEDEVVKNTDWLAKNLKPFGCQYDQIDDGWQGVGHGSGENRDWYVTEKNKFPHGMKWLASYIRSKGLTPGIWLIPFATSNEDLFRKHPEMFIRQPDGTSIGERKDPQTGKAVIDWTGRFIIDPTSRGGRQWFTDLFKMICPDWGYDYVKIDGQGGSRGACTTGHDQMANRKLAPDEAYRAGLDAIKAVMGPRRFLLNCGGQLDSDGYCDGIRIGGDVGPSWSGMQPAIQATMRHLFINNICFWTDPDVVCVRPRGNSGSSLTFDQARMWASLLGITGQLLMASDNMYDLPNENLELLRRIFPVADIRPMDLYPQPGKPRIFDLRVAKPGVGDWDVVALFNWSDTAATQIALNPRDLGLPLARYAFYDVWEKKLTAVSSQPLMVALPPASCRVIAVRRFVDHPQLLGTSRHITQGADDLLAATWDGKSLTWSGRSAVVGGDPYELRFTLPPGWSCTDSAARTEGPLTVLTLKRTKNETVPWKIGFQKSKSVAGAPTISDAKVEQVERSVRISWSGGNAIGYRIYRNGNLLTETSDTSFSDYIRHRGQTYRYEVSAFGWEGESARVPAGEITVQPPPRGTAKDVWLDQLRPESATQDYGRLRLRASVDGNPLRVGGKQFAHGLGTHANSDILFLLGNRYQRFEAAVGVDDEKGGAGTVDFQVFADGEKVFDSAVMHGKQAAKQVNIPLTGVNELLLHVTDAGDGINCDHADWCDARLIGNR